jgi:hypothetical protein
MLQAMEQSNSNNENENVAENENYAPSSCGTPTIDFTNEQGKVRVGVRKLLRDGILEQLHNTLIARPYEEESNTSGGFSICLGIDRRTGDKIWAHIGLTVNTKDPSIDPWTGKARRKAEYQVPQLFN